jgi:hypothetical protein
MRATNWSAPTTDAEAGRRAGGRRRYNRQRQNAARARRVQLAYTLMHTPDPWRGFLAGEAAYHRVNRSTISRDIQAIVAAYRAHEPTLQEMARWYHERYGEDA